jgi:hypothetical protein
VEFWKRVRFFRESIGRSNQFKEITL